ncbi:MAG: PilN domain-containing protein [Betaproteobacteria bacterium]|nr:PilN domain-containing protein [Betaproteobacteria bacterium]
MNAARINLLPHRAERRKRAKRHFATEQISNQLGRNQFLKSEIGKLDQEIAEINKLKDEIQALLARKQIIETLQADRAQTVHLLDELVKQMPEGVFLRSIIQKGMRVQLLGYAQSNARVSTLMRNIEASRWLGDPELIEVKSAPLDKRRVSEFTMFMSLKRAPSDAVAAPAGAPAPAAKKG